MQWQRTKYFRPWKPSDSKKSLLVTVLIYASTIALLLFLNGCATSFKEPCVIVELAPDANGGLREVYRRDRACTDEDYRKEKPDFYRENHGY
jgi:hypothetical protein